MKNDFGGFKSASAALRKRGIAYVCKKGNKPAPNQDDVFVLVDGDTTILGVFDGHGRYGHHCSNLAQQLLVRFLLTHPHYMNNLELALKESFKRVDEALRGLALRQGQFSVFLSGTTATVLVHRGQDLCIAHVGDSRAVLAQYDGSNKVVAEPLTEDHKPSVLAERKRIEGLAGEVRTQEPESPSRIFVRGENFPGLAMTRALGDDIAKCVGVICEPEIKSMKLGMNELFVTMCSDGVWEFMSNDKVVETINRHGRERLEEAAYTVAETAYNEWLEHEDCTTDDITCMIYYLK